MVGVFDGKVRVPFAELRSLHPKLVSILSHELAHAMISAATHGQAPHWFQEGLAEHVEMGLGRVNPLPDLAQTRRALSFPTIDPILRGFAEEQLVDLSYSEAAWALHFIETRYGLKAIHRLLAVFAEGKTTAQALGVACGISLAEFDRAFWDWGTSHAPASRDIEPRRYDREYATAAAREPTGGEDRAQARSQRGKPFGSCQSEGGRCRAPSADGGLARSLLGPRRRLSSGPCNRSSRAARTRESRSFRLAPSWPRPPTGC